jgi:hypothetical protein
MKATLTFKNASMAKHFASYWAYKTSMGSYTRKKNIN